jgi:hypothetical protein
VDAETAPLRNPRHYQYELDLGEVAEVWRRGSVVASWLLDLTANALHQDPTLSDFGGRVSDSGEGRWTCLAAIETGAPEQVLTQAVRGQYGEGVMPNGDKVPAYRTSPGVDPQSRTETYAAMKLTMDNWRWAGVPFYLRTGKRLTAQYTEVAIQFKRAPFVIFKDTAVEAIAPDMLVLRIQPNEGIQMSFGAKIPGPSMRVGTVNMDFSYADYFGNEPATGYELRDPDLRLHERRRHTLQTRRHGGEGLGDSPVNHGCLVRPAAPGLPQLRRRDLGPQAGRRPAQERRAPVAAHRHTLHQRARVARTVIAPIRLQVVPKRMPRKIPGTVRPGKVACSSGCESRLGNRAPRAQYRALRRGW